MSEPLENGEGFLVMSQRCKTCIFRPGNLMSLDPGRVKGMVRECLQNETHVTCHQSPRVTGEGELAVACRGFTEKWPGVSIAQRLGIVLDRIIEVDPETLERL